MTDAKTIKEEAIRFFSKKFREMRTVRPPFSNPNIKHLSRVDSAFLETDFSIEEIKNAIWNYENEKAPGPDVFTLKFIKNYWDLMKDDIMRFVKYFENSGSIARGCSSYFITLIPKIKDPLTLNDYRTFSLIGCLYKIIAIVMANQLKRVISMVVDEVQTSFVEGRNILDGPVIINKICYCAKNTKMKMFLFKVDFDKAFDFVNWHFLDSLMAQIGFGHRWRF